MKKIILSLVALLSMTAAMAQSSDNQSEKKGGKRPDPKEMVQKRTQDMVEKYVLSNEQATKLQALNEKYMGVMMMGGPHGGPRPDGMKKGERPEPPQGMKDGERPEPPKDMQQGGGKRLSKEEREQQMKEYDEGIKAILNADQYKAYTADKEKMDAERKAKREEHKSKKSE